MRDSFFTALTPGTVVLTATRLLADRLLHEHNLFQQQQGKHAWPTPQILSLANWLFHAWQMALENGTCAPLLLLNAEQELAVWTATIKASKHTSLLRLRETAQAAQQAWQLLKHWQLSPAPAEFAVSADTAAFQQWALAFNKRCKQAGWIDNASLPEQIIAAIAQHGISLPERLILIGFDELTPLTQALLESLAQQGCSYEVITSTTPAPQIQRIALNDTQDEIARMADWAQHILTTTENPLIGCIVPELDAIAGDIERGFRQRFLTANSDQLPFHLAQTTALSTYPLIHSALQILALADTSVDFFTLSAVLRSPFIAGAETELQNRALFDATLRKRAQRQAAPKIALAQPQACPRWHQHFKAFLQLTPKAARQPASAWAEHFTLQLQALGWPGTRTPNPLEQQLLSCWTDLLAVFASLDQLATQYNWQQALGHLQQLANSTYFQPAGMHKPIQILTPEAAAGMQFTHLWMLGLHQEAWPGSAHPNPFIPVNLQREQQMPHSSPERELDFCRLMTSRILASANAIMLSYPNRQQERSLQASRLIGEFPLASKLDSLAATNPLQLLFTSSRLESFIDAQGPPVLAEQPLTGGSEILKLQAACPLRAFTQIRLGAKRLEPIKTSLTAADKGNIIHKALELIWQTLGSHDLLCQYTPEQLQELITTTVDQALQEHLLNYHAKRHNRLEQQRMIRLLQQWLDLEKQRPPFTVAATEQRQTVELAGLYLTLRLDRIDRLANDNYLIIDYKTGRNQIEGWFGDRPDDPQLPLYAITAKEDIQGLAFAQLHSNRLGFKGYTAAAEHAPTLLNKRKHSELATDWPEQVSYWQRTLTHLAQQFQAGHAEIAPKNYPQTCQHCALPTFCRIYEQQPSLSTEADDADPTS